MSTRREEPRKPSAWLYPHGVEREYERELVGLADAVELLVREEIWPLLPQMRLDNVEDLPPSTGWAEVLRLGFIRVAQRLNLISVPITVNDIGAKVSAFNKAQFHKTIRSAYGVDVFVNDAPLVTTMKQWESQNIGLIKSIPEQALDKMQSKVFNAVQEGKLPNQLREELREEFGVTKRRAELIANDQIGKLNGQLTQERQKSIGVDEYTWRGVLDGRERQEHVAREGKVFSWSKPPPDGHPGYPIRCRCWAEPKLPLLGDLLALVPETEFMQ